MILKPGNIAELYGPQIPILLSVGVYSLLPMPLFVLVFSCKYMVVPQQ